MQNDLQHILIVSDTDYPHISGVSRKLEEIKKIESFKINTLTFTDFKISTLLFGTIPICLPNPFEIHRRLRQSDKLLIITPGILGLCTLIINCVFIGIPYITFYNTKWDVFVYELLSGWHYIAVIAKFLVTVYLKWFHSQSPTVTPSQSMKEELEILGYTNVIAIENGYNSSQFAVDGDIDEKITTLDGPKWLYVGRLSPEKNIDKFLDLNIEGTKIVVGDGLSRTLLEKKYPNVIFTGFKEGEELAKIYRSCDVFVFPSKFDTFGIVLVEALASGLPIAAYPVTGPKDVVTNGVFGCLDEDLKQAVSSAFKLKLTHDKYHFAEGAKKFNWDRYREKLDSLIQHLK